MLCKARILTIVSFEREKQTYLFIHYTYGSNAFPIPEMHWILEEARPSQNTL